MAMEQTHATTNRPCDGGRRTWSRCVATRNLVTLRLDAENLGDEIGEPAGDP